MRKVLRGWWTFCNVISEMVKKTLSTQKQEPSHRDSITTIDSNPGLSSSGSTESEGSINTSASDYDIWDEASNEEGHTILMRHQEEWLAFRENELAS